MPYHEWGDDWEHWQDLNDAIYECMVYWKKWGRIGSWGKEKWGCFRHEVGFYEGDWGIHELVKPGHAFYRWPKKLIKYDRFIGSCINRIGIGYLIRKWQHYIYNRGIQRVCAKYPHIVDELVSDSSYPELIKGKVDGLAIHNKYWTQLGDDT
jgi:hypothetical protein